MEDLKVDVVVIGSGAAGLCAALTAVLGGARVVVLEKMSKIGGYSLTTHGMFAAESVVQNRDFVEVTKDKAFKTHMHQTHWCANARLVRAFIDKSASSIDWLMDLGVEYTSVQTLWPGGPRTWHVMKGSGKLLIQALANKIKEKGGEIITETLAEKLLTDKKNRVTGVVAREKDGSTLHIDTRAVIIAGGSYANNREMIKEYANLPFEAPAIVEMQQTGDHIKMAWEAGAASDGMGVFMAIPRIPNEKSRSHLWAAAFQPLLWVNRLGERFCDESVSFYFPISANALAKQPDGIMYTIFDETTKKKLLEKGTDVSLGVYAPVTTKLAELNDDIKRGSKEGKVFVADSIKELAEKISIDPKALQETVAEYNESWQENYDKIFSKDRKYLQPVKNKKFYAIKSTFHIFATLGGIKINHKTEVLNETFDVIPGLYAAGNCAGGMYESSYEIFTTGGALGFAVNSGRIAGENILKYLSK